MIYFVSDIHADPENEESLETFTQFAVEYLREGDTLYILGDYFNFWIEYTNFILKEHTEALSLLKTLTDNGVNVKFILGNRDFAQRNYLQKYLNVEVIGDDTVIKCGISKIYLTHGDLLCTLDKRYQKWRSFSRNKTFLKFLGLFPPVLLYKLVQKMRKVSEKEIKKKSDQELDLVESEVMLKFKNGNDAIICGHIHRPQVKEYDVSNRMKTLITLGDWGKTGSFATLENVNNEMQLSLQEYTPGQ